jgi:hypothetical protein
MRKVGACIAIVALAAAAFSPSPSAAFGFNLGPFHLGLPLPGRLFGLRHGRRMERPQAARLRALHDEASLNAVGPAAGPDSALLYPIVAAPGLFEDVFWPSSSPWPFGYDAIFQTAFAKTQPDQAAHLCQQSDRTNSTNAIVERIRNEVRPTGAQLPKFQKLGGALGAAAAYLTRTCPDKLSSQPVARLQLMEWQIEKLSMALDIIRQPLQDFEQSLNDSQRARFAHLRAAPAKSNREATSENLAANCAVAAAAPDWPVEQISASVDPTDAQRAMLTNMQQTFSSAASQLDASCPTAVAADPLARLEATEARLDATWRAVLSIQVALASFEKGLSDQQRDRLDAIAPVAAR